MRPARCFLLVSLPFVAPVGAQQSAAILDAPLVAVRPDQRIDHLLDLNGDGRMDFIVMSEFDHEMQATVYLNDGQGGLVGLGAAVHSAGYGEHVSHMETYDANGDGKDDLVWVVSRLDSSTISGFMYVLTAPVRNPHLIDHLCYDPLYGQIDFGTLLDADQDGDVDRVRIQHSFSTWTLTLDLFQQDAGGAWSATSSTMTLPFVPDAMVRMDADGDAYPDLYLNHGTDGAFVSLAGGSLHAPVDFHHGISMPMALPGDVDGDGDQDLAFFDMTGYALYRRTGPASWTLEPRRAGGPAAKLADVDGDGDLDGVCCGGGGSIVKFYSTPSTFRVSLNDGTGGFAPAFTFPGLGSKEIAGAADLDGDGDVDLAAGQCIYFARGPLTHPPQHALSVPQSPRSLSDFDRDGDPDFTPGIGGFARHLGDGSTRAFTLLCQSPPAGASDEGPGLPGDWDGDGDVDLIVRRSQGGSFLEMHLLLNEGGGSYADGGASGAQDFLPGVTGVGPENSFAVDLDLDGDLDLATFRRAALSSDSWTRTWLNDGQGRFTLAWQGNVVWPLGFAALTGTSAPDALLVGYSGGIDDHRAVAYLHPGRGDGTFAPSVLDLFLGTDLGAASVVLEDLDHDGDIDIAGAFEFGAATGYEAAALFIPNIGGVLSKSAAVRLDDLDYTSITTPARPIARVALAGDVDGDGLEDLIFSSPVWRRAAVSIVRRAPDDQSWLAPVRQVVYPIDPLDGTNVAAVAGACLDVDGDGDAEYVTDAIWTNLLHSARDFGARHQDVSGLPDAAGRVPTLGASGPFRPGDAVTVRLSGVPAGATGILSLRGALPGSKALTAPGRFRPLLAFVTGGPSAPGAGSWSVAFPVPLSAAGVRHLLRADVVDPLGGGLVRSNELELDFGN